MDGYWHIEISVWDDQEKEIEAQMGRDVEVQLKSELAVQLHAKLRTRRAPLLTHEARFSDLARRYPAFTMSRSATGRPDAKIQHSQPGTAPLHSDRGKRSRTCPFLRPFHRRYRQTQSHGPASFLEPRGSRARGKRRYRVMMGAGFGSELMIVRGIE